MGNGASAHQDGKAVRGIHAIRAGVRLQHAVVTKSGSSHAEHQSADDSKLTVEGTSVANKEDKTPSGVLHNKNKGALGPGKTTVSVSSKAPKTLGNPTKEPRKKSVSSTNTLAVGNERKKKNKGGLKSPNVVEAIRSELSKEIDKVLHGDVEVKCPTNTKIIRIFLSSTFTDTEHERNALMERVYPKLKTFCQENGYEFQVVDMRWGVRDVATDLHETTELCIREIRACQKLSVGPNFITLLSEKYGYCPLPSSIASDEFEKLQSGTSNEDAELLNKWYRKDSNSIPASYILQPVTTWIPDYFKQDNEFLKEKAHSEWAKDFLALKNALITAVQKVFSDEAKWHVYMRSVCEVELEEGILKPAVDTDKCGWLHREFTGLDTNRTGSSLEKYIDTSQEVENGVDRKKLLHNLKESMERSLQGKNVLQYKVKWAGKGIDPSDQEHKEYIEKFCADFRSVIENMIVNSIADYKNSEINSPVYEEVVQHTLFCQAKLEMFHGRHETLQKIGNYIKGDSRKPLVLHGRSGCGKTSVMAMTAKHAREWIKQEACIVLRFLGTTPKSSTIRRVLRSVSQQIKSIYKLTTKIPRNKKDLVEFFPTLLSSATKEKPLVVIFDSLDQLASDDGARQLGWMPKNLPEYVRFIVSTLPDAQFRCFPKLQAMFKDPKLYVAIPSLPQSDVSNILAKWLQKASRTLQAEQLKAVEDAIAQCPLPLFLKISFDQACRWRSYMPLDKTQLHSSVRDAIDSLFDRTEQKHGRILVRHALGYLTAARSGLTEGELDDILSCDDEVLDDVFQYWMPPIRRLPPLLWVRIRADLGSYLVDRGAEGARVTCWYHRQFIEAARDRYLSDELQKTKLHSNIADYFLGKYSDVSRSKETKAHRGKFVRLCSVPPQPLKLSRHKYNLRKLHELPYHLIHSKRWHELKTAVFCCYDWLEAKIRARSLRAVLDDFHLAKEVCRDPDITAVAEILQLGQDAILADPCQLASQLVSRLYDRKEQEFSLMKSNLSETLADLLQDAHGPVEPSLLSCRAFLTPPGGQLVQTLVGHKKGVYGLAATRDGTCAVSGSQDGSVKVWSISDGSVLVTVEDLGEDIGAIQCADEDKRIVVSSKKGITVLDIETGEIQHSFNTKFFTSSPPFSLAGEKKRKVAYFTEKSLKIVDVITGKLETELRDIKPVGETGQNTVLSAWDNVLLCNSAQTENSLQVVDVCSGKVTHSFEVFDKEDDDNFLHLTEIAFNSKDQVLVAKKMRIDTYDVKSGTKLKSIRGKLDDWISHISVILDVDLLVFPKRDKVVLVNTESGQRQEILKHSNYVSRVLAASDDIMITSGGDSVIRVWDLSREDVHRPVGKPETLLRVYHIPDDPRHVITVGRLGIDNHVITTWDMSTFLPVRRVTNISSSYLKVINARKAALRVGDRVAVVGVNTWKVQCIMKGKLPEFAYAGTPDLCTVNNNTEILTYALHQKSLKTYNVETGELSGELKGPRQEYKIQAFIVNTEGTVLAHNDEPLEVIFVWDVIKREMLFKVTRSGYERFVLTLASFTPDGGMFVLSIRRTQKTDYIRHPSVWDVLKRKLVHDLRYEDDTDSHSLATINNNRTMTSHKDMNIVIWDHMNGTAQYVLPSIHYGCRVDVLSSGGRFAISHDDKTIVLWNVEEGRQVCSFTADKITAIQPLYQGDVIALGYDSPLPLVALRLQGQYLDPYTCPMEGTHALGGLDLGIVFEGIEGKYVDEDHEEKEPEMKLTSEEKISS